jgi:hypothetical protein
VRFVLVLFHGSPHPLLRRGSRRVLSLSVRACVRAGKAPWEPLLGLTGCAVGIADEVVGGTAAAVVEEEFVCVAIAPPASDDDGASQKLSSLTAEQIVSSKGDDLQVLA